MTRPLGGDQRTDAGRWCSKEVGQQAAESSAESSAEGAKCYEPWFPNEFMQRLEHVAMVRWVSVDDDVRYEVLLPFSPAMEPPECSPRPAPALLLGSCSTLQSLLRKPLNAPTLGCVYRRRSFGAAEVVERCVSEGSSGWRRFWLTRGSSMLSSSVCPDCFSNSLDTPRLL